jgi:hypothetical protein
MLGLSANIRGPARIFYMSFSQDERADYYRLVDELAQRFRIFGFFLSLSSKIDSCFTIISTAVATVSHSLSMHLLFISKEMLL